jgi:hypothetical protein
MSHNKITVSRLGSTDTIVADRAAARALIRSRRGLIGRWSQWYSVEHYGRTVRYRKARWYASPEAKATDTYDGLIVEEAGE